MSQAVPYPKAMAAFPRLRQSLLAQFDRCSLSTNFALTLGDATSHDQARGQVFHRVAAKCIEEMAAHGEERVEIDVATAVMEECLRQHDVDDVCPRCTGPQEPVGDGTFRCQDCGREGATQMVALPAEQVRHLRMSVIKWAKDSQFSIDKLVSVEERLWAEVSYPSPQGSVVRQLSGQTDVMFYEGPRHVLILDWKDTWGLPPETELSFGGYFQQRMYAFLVFSTYPRVERVTLREVYHRFNENREADIHREELGNIRAELSALAERFDRAYEQSLWRPSPGKHCSYCTAPSKCPITPLARGEGMIADAQMARRVAAETCVAEAVVKRNKAAMKAYVNRTGRAIHVDDAKSRRGYGFESTTVRLRPTPEQVAAEVAAAQAEGRPPNIEGLYRERVQSKFSLHIPADMPPPEAEDAKLAEMMRSSLDSIRAAKEK